MKYLTILIVCIAVLVSAQITAQQDIIIRMSKLSVTPEMLVFFSGLPQEKTVLLYNFGNTPLKWSLGPASRFLKIDASNVPNPLQPLTGAFIKVSVVWDSVPAEAGTIEKPGHSVARETTQCRHTGEVQALRRWLVQCSKRNDSSFSHRNGLHGDVLRPASASSRRSFTAWAFARALLKLFEASCEIFTAFSRATLLSSPLSREKMSTASNTSPQPVVYG